MLAWFGPGFATGAGVLFLILLGEIFDGSFGLSELPLVFRHPKWPPRVVLATLAVECILISVLARQFGAPGAAAGFAASMFVLAIIRLALVHRKFGFRVITQSYFFVALIALICAAPAFAVALRGPEIWASAAAANLIFVALYVAIAFRLLRKRKPSIRAEATSPSH
jgi:O-antigen/teichoic acid export membrane protein